MPRAAVPSGSGPKGGGKPRTADSYRTTVEVHLKPAFGAVKLKVLNPHTIQGLYNGTASRACPLSL